jgi:small neutral amino acid transporter SnatA (MarC family)
MTFNLKEIISVTLILFSVIDVIGSLPVIIDLRQKVGTIESEKATFVSGVLMVSFLFVGERLLSLFGVDVSSFAVAGALIIFLLGLEMILGRTIFKSEIETDGATQHHCGHCAEPDPDLHRPEIVGLARNTHWAGRVGCVAESIRHYFAGNFH